MVNPFSAISEPVFVESPPHSQMAEGEEGDPKEMTARRVITPPR